jgi:predicted  nucleic acid-binding Zn-ribbon protein
LPIDFLTELEQKIDILLKNLEQLREEKKTLSLDIENKNQRVAQLEEENRLAQSEISSLKSVNADGESKRKAVTEKIQGLLAKIEAV